MVSTMYVVSSVPRHSGPNSAPHGPIAPGWVSMAAWRIRPQKEEWIQQFHRSGVPEPGSDPAWDRALKAAGVKSFRFHDLRHSCASALAQNGATLLEIAEVLGHRQLSVTKRYSHLATDHKTKLINRVLGDIR